MPALPRHVRRRGFTLTELLVVISIIAILASLTGVAVVRGLLKAKQTRIKIELDQLDMALKAYKQEYGAYPPCDLRVAARVRQHFAQRFPRYYNLNNVMNDLRVAGLDPVDFRPDQALVFWLRNAFSTDPTHPLLTWDGYVIENGARTTRGPITALLSPLYDFDQTRLGYVATTNNPNLTMYANSDPMYQVVLNHPLPSYFPQGSPVGVQGAPYVYFDSNYYTSQLRFPDPPPVMGSPRLMFNVDDSAHYFYTTFTNAGPAQQYAYDQNGNGTLDYTDVNGNGMWDVGEPAENWVNPESFQLVAAGSDGKYGNPAATGLNRARLYPTGVGYDTTANVTDDDNVTSFCKGARLGDDRP